MKLTFSCYTLFIIIISVDGGLVKQLFGNVKEDVHTVVDGTVSIIGKGTHKITEGLGVFLHRNEGNKFPGPKTEAPASSNQIPNDKKLNDSNNYNETTNNVQEENTSVNENHAHYNHVKSTPATTVTHPKTEDTSNSNSNIHVPENSYSKPTTESNSNNVEHHEDTNNNIITHDHTVVPTADINDVTTTETSWLNGAELENILPTIAHNETHFNGNTNELDAGENIPNDTGVKESNKPTVKCDDTGVKESNKPTVKCDDVIKPVESQNGSKANLVSDQLFFYDNKPKPNETKNYVCAEGLVRTANGECLKQIEIDVRKKVEPLVYNIFQADGCASGYARALDGSCQKIIG